MEMPKDYNETEGFTGEFETIKLGGHVCKIRGVKMEKSQKTNKDMLVIAFDIEKGENKGYYDRQYARKLESMPIDQVKFPGTYRIMVLDNEGKCNKFFKGFTTSVEASNPGYKFTGDEKTLKDKLFGGIFGREQYEKMDGTLGMTTKLRFIRSINGIEDIVAPEDKLLPAKADNPFDNFNANTENAGDDLPF